ncbi:MAG: carbohydrate kinase family protein [Anaerolineae bacterium]|nr:carbohydrate kinase family protein [Phycisphaerae bacterium]
MDAAVFGLLVADLVAQPMECSTLLAPGGLTRLNSITLTSGGNACNVAIAMAKFGMSVASAGLVGDDSLGRTIVERLREAGVNANGVTSDARAQTSATIVAVQGNGERCFFHTPGVTDLVDAKVFRSQFDLFRRAAWLQIGYFGLLPNLTKDLPELLAEFRSSSPGTKIALDTSYPPADRNLLDTILPHVDLFAPSRSEATALSGETKPARMVASFRQHMRENAIIGIKLDAEGCYLDDGQKGYVVPVFKLKVIDTTGAGDAWFAGLLCGLRKGMKLEESGRLANRVGADCCTALGASAGVRNLEATLASMK